MSLPLPRPHDGPVVTYLLALKKTEEGTRVMRDLIQSVRTVGATPEGKSMMELLTSATVQNFLDPLADDRALAVSHAQRFIALDLQRIQSREFDAHLVDPPARRRNRDRISGA